MPVIGIPVGELTARLGTPVGRDDLLRVLGEIGCDVEGYETFGRVRCAACGYVIELVGKEAPPPRCDRCDAGLRAPGAALEMPGQCPAGRTGSRAGGLAPAPLQRGQPRRVAWPSREPTPRWPDSGCRPAWRATPSTSLWPPPTAANHR